MSTDLGDIKMFDLPPGIDLEDAKQWYSEHMPPGRDFRSLTWLESYPVEEPSVDWYWCVRPGQSLDIKLGEEFEGNERPGTGGAFISIAVQDVSDGACS